ncbi:MAG: acyltransferase family protein, partial [Akkermansia sp.]|nr:acyltransferase family protein [Akkermansia sp.]
TVLRILYAHGAMSVSNMKAKQYVPHITGLRGFAILAIVAFHYLAFFPNGYLGVDIFLVISGFFLFRNIGQQDIQFSFGEYIKKKFVRLWPATICIAIICPILVLGLLPYVRFRGIAHSAIASLMGCANIYYDYSVDGYFEAMNSVTNPLVHTWYLSMIAQIYLLSGLLILFLRRRAIMTRYVVYVLCMLISFCLYNLPNLVDFFSFHIAFSTYYWSSGRFWIVLSGGLASVLPDLSSSPRFRAFIGSAALLVLVSTLFCWEKIPMPMVAELSVVVCSIICVRYGGLGVCARVLGSRSCGVLGKYSFSLYLTHWPVLVFFSAYSLSLSDDYLMFAAALACSAASAILFYHVVEVRRFKWVGVFVVSFFSIAFLLLLKHSERVRLYALERVSHVFTYPRGQEEEAIKEIQSGKLYQTLPNFRKLTYEGGLTNVFFSLRNAPLLHAIGDSTKEPNFLLAGDSHAIRLGNAFNTVAKRNDWHGVLLDTYVAPIEDYYYGGIYCNRWDKQQAEMLMDYLQKNSQISTVIFVNWWKNRIRDEYTDWQGNTVDSREQPEFIYNHMRAFLLRLRACGKRVVLLTDNPTFDRVKSPSEYIRKHCWLGVPLEEEILSCTLQEYERDNGRINSYMDRLEQEGLCRVVHLEKVFFKDGTAHYIQDGVQLYDDQHHLTYAGAIMAIESVEEELQKILGVAPQSDSER